MSAPNNCQPRAAHGRLYGRLFSLLGTLAVLVFTSPSGASTLAIEVYQNWSLRCAAEGGGPNNQIPPCEIVQVVRPRDGDAPVLQLAFAYNAKRGVYGVYLVLPNDIRMSGGLVVRLDGAVDLDYRVVWCDGTACISEKLSGEGEIALFKGAGKGFVAVVDGDGSLQTIPLSFLGFNQALTAMIDLNRKWAAE